jgi:ADP-heptose:LPS heptosyltransferase
MKVGIIIDGGAGRVICSVPAILKYIKQNPDYDVNIFCEGWSDLFWGIPEIESKLFSLETTNVFETQLRNCDIVLSPEPYRLPSYFNQKTSLAQAFNEILNNTQDHSDLETPELLFSKKEKICSREVIENLKRDKGHQKSIVIQPFGRSAVVSESGKIYDETSRSLNPEHYIQLVQLLGQRYNLLFFGEQQFRMSNDNMTGIFNGNLRSWASIIEAADYFVGCDSVGQHMARATNTPGTVIVGSTFAENSTYPDYFNVVSRNVNKRYSPIRLSMTDSHLADRINEDTMNFTNDEINQLANLISSHLESVTP